MHLEALGLAVPAGLGWRLALAAPIVLITVIGGRIIPNFTRNWLIKRKARYLPATPSRFDIACVMMLAVAFLLWAFLPDYRATGALLLVAALFSTVRLSRWGGFANWPESLLFILHVGYGWVCAGAALLGLSIFEIGVPTASAIHALTAGAIAVMILAVMPRVTLGHTGRDLTANRATSVVFVLINAAAIARVCASWLPSFMAGLLAIAGALWIAAFGLFVLIYGPMLLTRRIAS
jgi:uncharacterized protein involved in response to NO